MTLKQIIIIELIFVLVFVLCAIGGYLLGKSNLIGIPFIIVGILILIGKWKYEDKIKKDESHDS